MAKAKKKKFYVVWNGVTPGIYDSWTACQLQISGYPGATYKSYKSMEEAAHAWENGPDLERKRDRKSTTPKWDETVIKKQSISVDAACSGNPGLLEYRGVDTYNKDEIFRMGPFKKGTNNVGEFLALVHGIAYLQKIGDNETTIYSDSRIAMGWVEKKMARTKLQFSHENAILKQLIDRAEHWLKTNTYKNPIIKWETKLWGEIPADFGRK